jgi:restriction system protein
MDISVNTEELRQRVNSIRDLSGRDTVGKAKELLAEILSPLFAREGLTLSKASHLVDFVAMYPSMPGKLPTTVAVEYKHYSEDRVDMDVVRRLYGLALLRPYDRVLLISRTGFTRLALEEARMVEPVAIELLDLDAVESWAVRVAAPSDSTSARVILLIRTVSHEFAVLVARDPFALEHLEWRDLERMMARVMEGIGFDVVLTPPSKDGGKDLILSCKVRDGERIYIVELKHWRSGVRVGKKAVKDFLSVMVSEGRSGALFLSTSGYAIDAFEGLTEIERRRLRFGDVDKIVALAQTYVRAQSGLWSPPAELPEVLFETTA